MQHIHACRFVYNHSLEQKIRAYEQDGRKLSCFDLNNRLPTLKEEHPWLNEVNSQSLQIANKNRNWSGRPINRIRGERVFLECPSDGFEYRPTIFLHG